MPIIIVSVDGKNVKLEEFRELTKHIDLMIESSEQSATALGDYIASFVKVNSRIDTDRLSSAKYSETEQDIYIRMQSVYTLVQSLNISTAIIISHHNVLNVWRNNLIDKEWEIISMH